MTVAPIVKSVSVPLPPARCFTLFTSHMDRWWKPDMHIAATPYRTIVIEPHAEGRWFEVDEDGHETQWGRVLAWEPPHRLLLGWQLNARFQFDPDFLTEVESVLPGRSGGNAGCAGAPPTRAVWRGSATNCNQYRWRLGRAADALCRLRRRTEK